MCTIVAIHGAHRDASLIIAANRDELYSRPSVPPSVLEPGIVGGRDALANGTWLGVTEGALFVAVTNQRTMRPPEASRKSRGELVMAALRNESARAVVDMLEGIDGRAYNPFNLLFGDGTALYVAYAREEKSIHVELLQPGVIVLANDRIGAPEYPKTRRAEALLTLDLPLDGLLDNLHTLLGDHDKPREIAPAPSGTHFSAELLHELQALCIHTPFYGTRSSAIVALSPSTVHRYEHAEGPPCVTPFVDYSRYFAAIARTS